MRSVYGVTCPSRSSIYKTQVADLIINAPLKAYQRRGRALSHYNYFQDFAQRVRSGEKVKWEPPSLQLHEGILLHLKAHQQINAGAVPAAIKEAFEILGFCPNDKGDYHVYRSHEIFFPAVLRDVDAPPTKTKEKDIRDCPDEIHNLVQVVTRKERDDDDDIETVPPTGTDIETVPPTGTATSATVSPGVLSVSQVLRMNKKECLEELEKRGLPLTSKESLSRLRETLIQNFSSQAAPQVEVTIPTHVDTTTADASGARVPVGEQLDVTSHLASDARTPVGGQLDVTFDLTTDEDVWCICGKPDDGRRHVQCSQKETCIGVKDGLLSAGLMQLTIFNNIYYGMRYSFGYILMDYHDYIKNYNDIQVT